MEEEKGYMAEKFLEKALLRTSVVYQ